MFGFFVSGLILIAFFRANKQRANILAVSLAHFAGRNAKQKKKKALRWKLAELNRISWSTSLSPSLFNGWSVAVNCSHLVFCFFHPDWLEICIFDRKKNESRIAERKGYMSEILSAPNIAGRREYKYCITFQGFYVMPHADYSLEN